jgi:hypothetical protein
MGGKAGLIHGRGRGIVRAIAAAPVESEAEVCSPLKQAT